MIFDLLLDSLAANGAGVKSEGLAIPANKHIAQQNLASRQLLSEV